MKKIFLIVLVLFVFISCSVRKAHIQEINRKLASQDERIAILTEQMLLIDFENLQSSSVQTFSQSQRNERETSSNQPILNNAGTLSNQRMTPDSEINNTYEEGRRLYTNRNFAGAIRSFTAVTAQAPNHELASNSFYWIGESYYALGDFSAARLAFQIVLDQYPSSNKNVDSQLKIAMTWIRQNRRDQARTILESIRRNHPNYERMDLVEQNLRLVR